LNLLSAVYLRVGGLAGIVKRLKEIKQP
jgi:hypothetical protein